jgi:hypothetical protein
MRCGVCHTAWQHASAASLSLLFATRVCVCVSCLAWRIVTALARCAPHQSSAHTHKHSRRAQQCCAWCVGANDFVSGRSAHQAPIIIIIITYN